jgi:hypothetical protein
MPLMMDFTHLRAVTVGTWVILHALNGEKNCAVLPKTISNPSI